MPATLEKSNQFLSKYYENNTDTPIIIEAGGGSFNHFYTPLSAMCVIVDISHGQLKKNEFPALMIQGDAQMLPLKNNSANVVICFNVIEHLISPVSALISITNCLDENGLLILGCPERSSLKGFITRLTPISLHRAFYKYIVKKKDRGDGHFDAFETPFNKIVSKKKLLSWLLENGYSIEFMSSYDGAAEYGLTTGTVLRRLIALPYYMLSALLSLLTFGKLFGKNSDILIIARKGK